MVFELIVCLFVCLFILFIYSFIYLFIFLFSWCVGGFAVVYKAKSSQGGLYALKRMAVNNLEDLHLARQEVAITVSGGRTVQ